MRSAQKNNRSRGRGSRKSGGGGGGGGGNIINRVYDSAGPEGKVRGTPQQIIDKYLSLARDAQTTGDRVMSENFLQHAEHYQRLLMTATAQQEQNRRDQSDDGQDDDGDERESGQGERREQHGQGERREQHGQAGQQQPQQPQPQAQRQARDAGDAGDGGEGRDADEIGGMTTIDSGSSGAEDLLVVSDEVGQAQPARRNGDGRRRRPRRDREAAPEPTGETQPVEQEN